MAFNGHRAHSKVKRVIKNIPIIRDIARIAYSLGCSARFANSSDYWQKRYASGGDSGLGSHGELARFKADTINGFVRRNNIRSVIEFGCGDGNQLLLAEYPRYLGFDISFDAISSCRKLFKGDTTKSFDLIKAYNGEHADLALSLDVLYHLVEDEVFSQYMAILFRSADRFVIIYSSNTDDNPVIRPPHVKHRNFSRWIQDNLHAWTLEKYIPNCIPQKQAFDDGSFADFWIYQRK